MTKQVAFVALIAMFALMRTGGIAAAEHAVTAEQASSEVSVPTGPEGEQALLPAASREVCTTVTWGWGDVVKTDCRYAPLPASRGNPALHGICTTYYGNRTCY